MRASLLRLAPVRALRRAPGLNAMIVVTLAFGLSVWLSTHAMAQSFEQDPMRDAPHLFRVELVRYTDLRGILRGTDMELVSELPSLVLSPGEVDELSSSSIPSRTAAVTTAELPFEEPGASGPRMGWVRFLGRDAFALFGVRLAAGRVFDEGKNELLVSERDARRWFGGSAAALGRTLLVSGNEWHIAGVVAAGAALGRRLHLADPAGEDVLWMPFGEAVHLGVLPVDRHHPGPRTTAAANGDFSFASLWVELTDAAAAERFREWLGRWSASHPGAGVPRIRRYQEWSGVLGTPPAYRVVELFGAATLAACCLTLVRLFHTRNRLNERDIALRRALGASRRLLLVETLAEAGVVVVVAALVGVALAAGSLELITFTLPGQTASFTLPGATAVAGVAVGMVAGILAALLPAWRACAETPARALRAAA